ncbi:MAG TPA: hypothetical protein VID24_02745 [Candidatus Eremiobacteraceae bacterium]
MKTILVILAIVVVIGLILPVLHLLAVVLAVVVSAIVVMAAWKVLFGGNAAAAGIGQDRGGPPAING